MEENKGTFYLAKNIADIFYHIKTVSDLRIVGSCTQFIDPHCEAVSTYGIPELQTIDKKERYVDFGPAVTLAQIASMGRTNIPNVLYDAVETTATGPVRNIATLAGNICREGQKGTLYAPLLALDAELEVKSQSSTWDLLKARGKRDAEPKVKSLSSAKRISTKRIKFMEFNGIPKDFVITKIRVPVNDWEVSVFKKIGPESKLSPLGASFVFLVDTENDRIVNMKIAFTGEMVFRSRELENKLTGYKLPLQDRAVSDFLVAAEELSQEEFNRSATPPILKDQFLSLLEYNLKQLS